MLKAVRSLKCKHSAGPDGFTVGFVKGLSDGITFPLMLTFVQLFHSGKLPDDWKKAINCDMCV